MISPQLKPLSVPIDGLTLDPQNARQHDERGIDAVKASLERFGQLKPIVVQAKGRIVRAGNATVLAAQALGWTEIAANVKSMTNAEAQAYAIADNRTAELATWDDQTLLDTIQALKDDPTIDEVVTGFDDDEIAALVATLNRPGFRTGEGWDVRNVDHWRGEDEFFACSDEVLTVLSKKRHLVVSASGGIDSLACMVWVRRLFPDIHTVGVFADPGVEFPGMGAYLADVCEILGVELQIVKAKEEWWSWLAKNGWPSMLYRQCAGKFVHAPIAAFTKKEYSAEETAVFTGSRATEAIRGSKKTESTPLPSMPKYFHFAPVFNVTKEVSTAAVTHAGVHMWPGYARGFVRTACWCCMGQCGEQACALQDNYPGLADEIRQWEKRLGPLRADLGRGALTFDRIVAAGRKRIARSAAKETAA